jgi:hypothetical protein
MSEELEPLGPLALRALAAEQRRGDVDAMMQERLLGRIVASVAVGAAATAVAGTAAAATTAAAAGQAGASAAAGATGAAATGLTIKALPWIIAAFVAGGGAGAAIHAAVAPSASSPPQPSLDAPITTVAPPVSPSPLVSAGPSLPSIPASALPPATSPIAVAPRASASAPPATSGGNDVDLAAERALVDRARTALSRGQSRDALDALDTHASRYPRGRLSEEREALAIDALARAGRLDDARSRAVRFRSAYPNSVFGAVVEAAVAPR